MYFFTQRKNKKKTMKMPLMVDYDNRGHSGADVLRSEANFKKRCTKETFSCLSNCASYLLNALHRMAKDTEHLLYLWISFSALNTPSDQDRQYEIIGNSTKGESGARVYYSLFLAYGIVEFYHTLRSRLTRNQSLRDYVGRWHAIFKSANQAGIYGTYYVVFFSSLVLEFSGYNFFPEKNDADGHNRLVLLEILSSSVVLAFTLQGFYSCCKGERFLEWYHNKPMADEALNDRLRSLIKNGENSTSSMNERAFTALLESIEKEIENKVKIKQQKNNAPLYKRIPAILYTATWDSIQGTILYWLLSGALKVIDSSIINLAYFNGLAIMLNLPGNLLENVFKAEGLKQEPAEWYKNLHLFSIITSNFIDITNQLITIDNLLGPAFVAVAKDQYRSEQTIDLGGFNYFLTFTTVGLTAFIISRNAYRNYSGRDNIINRVVKFHPPEYKQVASQIINDNYSNIEMEQINNLSESIIISALNQENSSFINQQSESNDEDSRTNDVKEYKASCKTLGAMSIFIYKPDEMADKASFTQKIYSCLPSKCCG